MLGNPSARRADPADPAVDQVVRRRSPRGKPLSGAPAHGTLGATVSADDLAPTDDEPLPLRRADGRSILGERPLRAARAVAEALFAAGDAAPPPARIDWLMAELDDFTARAGVRARLVLRLAIFAVSILAPLFIGRVPPLRALALSDRIRALAALERRFGEPLLALKAVLCILYYEHPDVAREAGFDAECHLRSDTRASVVSPERLRRLEKAGGEARR